MGISRHILSHLLRRSQGLSRLQKPRNCNLTLHSRRRRRPFLPSTAALAWLGRRWSRPELTRGSRQNSIDMSGAVVAVVAVVAAVAAVAAATGLKSPLKFVHSNFYTLLAVCLSVYLSGFFLISLRPCLLMANLSAAAAAAVLEAADLNQQQRRVG